MKTFALFLLAAVVATFGADPGELDPNLAALKPFLGSWRGEFKRSTPENPLVDTAVWERALNGKAVRILHSINDGTYGGETLVTWDEAKKSIVYHYFTTAGFQTKGTMKISANKLECHEVVTGSGAEGAAEVKSTMELKEDGQIMESNAKYLKNSEWVQGHEVKYKRSDGAKPLFK
jgi:hypothetical protein